MSAVLLNAIIVGLLLSTVIVLIRVMFQRYQYKAELESVLVKYNRLRRDIAILDQTPVHPNCMSSIELVDGIVIEEPRVDQPTDLPYRIAAALNVWRNEPHRPRLLGGQPWTDAEETFLLVAYGKLYINDIAILLDRTPSAIKKRLSVNVGESTEVCKSRAGYIEFFNDEIDTMEDAGIVERVDRWFEQYETKGGE